MEQMWREPKSQFRTFNGFWVIYKARSLVARFHLIAGLSTLRFLPAKVITALWSPIFRLASAPVTKLLTVINTTLELGQTSFPPRITCWQECLEDALNLTCLKCSLLARQAIRNAD